MTEQLKPVLSEEEAAKFLNIHRVTLAKLRRAGKSPNARKVGRQYRYSLEALKDWVSCKDVKDAIPVTDK